MSEDRHRQPQTDTYRHRQTETDEDKRLGLAGPKNHDKGRWTREAYTIMIRINNMDVHLFTNPLLLVTPLWRHIRTDLRKEMLRRCFAKRVQSAGASLVVLARRVEQT